ncbi:MAG TPA: AAA family ATPase [Acidimicrobiales bacterium]|nr:AAA family ATPase [Acidimicrobiales bacterium]
MTTDTPNSPLARTQVRELSAQDLNLFVPENATYIANDATEHLEDLVLQDNDDILLTTNQLLSDFGGVIFVGPPGTSKSWYASAIAVTLAKGKSELVRFVQFHPSYQYEDFVEGYIPDEENGGFVLTPKHLLQMCRVAVEHPNEMVFIVIDELSRVDPGRVFGEALTYIEKSKRGLKFRVASGTECSIPANLYILATMNPQDRGVDEVDAAFERRFAKIQMDPSRILLGQFLEESGMPADLRRRVEVFFMTINGRAAQTPAAAIGHTFFRGIGDEASLQALWDHQLRFLLKKAYVIDPHGYADAEKSWNQIVPSKSPSDSADTTTASPED